VKARTLIAVLLLNLPVAVADSDVFTFGDFLFVRAQVIGCSPHLRLVEYGQVTESGEMTLFGDISLNVKGKVTDEIAAQLVDGLEQKTGHRSKTIQIVRIPEANVKKRTWWLMSLYQDRKCQLPKPYGDYPDWQFNYRLALNTSHIKAVA
jgi:hypothetical protein